MGNWIQTRYGKRVDVTDLDIHSIDINDIAHSLSNLCRFNGHTNEFYSVASHSVHTAWLTMDATHNPHYALVSLLHDASEAYLTDIPSPIKKILKDYAAVEKTLMQGIHKAFGISEELAAEAEPHVKRADNIALVTEFSQLFDGDPIDNWTSAYPVEADPTRFVILPPEDAKDLFLLKYHELRFRCGQ